jgi:hypothetical protein
LLREIRDLLGSREQQYADHLKAIQDLYEQQLAIARQDRERAISAVALIVGIVAAIGGALYIW